MLSTNQLRVQTYRVLNMFSWVFERINKQIKAAAGLVLQLVLYGLVN
jgi:hypothetical protein